jgi:hypothetical protein
MCVASVCGVNAFELVVTIKSLLAQFAYGWQPPQIDHPLQRAVSILTLTVKLASALFMASENYGVRKALGVRPNSKYEVATHDRSKSRLA